MSKDYYEILSVSREASQADIKKAYRKIAFKYHPDRTKGDKDKEEIFKQASEAYQVLGDPKKREQYDRFGHNAFGDGGGFQNLNDIFSTFSDIFSTDIFGGGGFEDLFSSGRSRQRSRERGADLYYQVKLNLKEVLTGTEKEVSFQGDGVCLTCKGSGAKPGTRRRPCSSCGGQGQSTTQKGFFTFTSTCSVCRGVGTVLQSPCGSCYGKGILKKRRTLSVKIPPGVNSGTKLRLQGEGEPGAQGGEAGDFYLEVQLESHPKFIKKDRDLKMFLSITYLQALLGTRKSFQSLIDKQTLDIPPGTSHGDQIRIPYQGLPGLNNPTRGDLICEIKVEFPKKLKKKEEEFLREIATFKKETVLEKKKTFF